MRNKKKNKYLLLLILLLALTVGYAALATTLKINGTATIGKNTWSVHWDNTPAKIVVTDGSVSTEKPTITKEGTDPDDSLVSWSVTLNLPGDFYEFEIDAVNDGTVDAMITGIETKIGNDYIFKTENGEVKETTPSPLPKYLDYTIKYKDGSDIELNHLLKKQTGRETYKVRVALNDKLNPGDLPQGEDGVTYTFTFKVNYSQADSNAVVRPSNLDEESWDTIVSNLQNNPKSYGVGSTKAIDLDINGNGEIDDNEHFHLRIVNTSKPAECNTEGFSQTACGVVVEFEEILFKEKYNSSWTNAGGYPSTNLYNNYLKNNSPNWIYNLLPSALQAGIIDTYAASGKEFDSTVFSGGNRPVGVHESTDKIYLLGAAEVWESGYDYDSAASYTRQLDYYKQLGTKIEAGNNAAGMGAVKKFNGTDDYWWLRTARPDSYSSFYRVTTIGAWNGDGAADSTGVSPAFRIGNTQ